MTKILLISDTHSYMDQRILHFASGVDELWHGGDIGSLDVMEQLEKTVKVRAVYGNIDDQKCRNIYPENQIFTLEGVKVFMTHIAGSPPKYSARVKEIIQEVENQSIGGLIFMQNSAQKQIALTNRYQSLAKVPLLIGMDAEWDLAMRLENTHKFPWAMTMGALSDEDLVYQVGERIASHAKRIGVHMNFGPVVDINVNPSNPIIGNRSFGSNRENVSHKAVAYARGMQDQYVLGSAKHFPGHGDTSQDSHKTLPTITHDLAQLDSLDLYPFKRLIDAKVASIMVAHLNVPALEPNATLPSSLSKKIITDLLKNKLGYKGLIITDALNMQGVAAAYAPGEVDLKAFEAGNDILLFSQAVETGKSKIKQALENGTLSQERLEESVRKILNAKYYAGLNKKQVLSDAGLYQDLNDAKSSALNQAIFEQAITLVKNQDNMLPIQNIKDKTFAFVALEESDSDTFYTYLKKYTKVDLVAVNTLADVAKLKSYDYVIVGVHKSTESPYKSYKISESSQALIEKISSQNSTIVALFTSAYGLKTLPDQKVKSILVGYQNSQEAQKAMPQIIFGALESKGHLPVDVNEKYKYSDGIQTPSLGRLSYTHPHNAGMSQMELDKIKGIAEGAIDLGATPGMQVLVAKDGRVVFDESFGYQSNLKEKKVDWEDIYDVASITKIIATLPLIIKSVEKGEFSLDQTLSSLLPQTLGSNKENLVIKDILTHRAGLYPWVPFYKETMNLETKEYFPGIYQSFASEEFPTQVAENLYLIKDFDKQMFQMILSKEQWTSGKSYKYSDLGYYFFNQYYKDSTGKNLDELTSEFLYKPLGATTTGYLPLSRFDKEQIIPTEDDRLFRKQLVHGFVHDQGAAMLGGVAGHAGVFSNANDLAKIMQMYLNGGYYGGERYLSKELIDQFSSYQFKSENNRRGIGFDKQLGDSGSACKCVSELSYGHTGFTGTMAWVDPKTGLLYVFLSNRINPSAENQLLISKDIREKIQKVIYDAILPKGEEKPYTRA
ncbi:MAG: beta-N-acetylglucosaminidase [Flavobacteriaceae bacterium]|nr:MAG: beta-N-acetylglucosaminidase [Flavobacteriaceae bacterium]